jgi:hypothetical protein
MKLSNSGAIMDREIMTIRPSDWFSLATGPHVNHALRMPTIRMEFQKE